MSKKSFNGKYLTLENVRVYYDEKNDSISLTSKDKDIPQGKSFNLTLNNGKEAETILRDMLEEKKMLPESYLSSLPDYVGYEDREGPSGWDVIPLGIGRGGREISWNTTKAPHLLLNGSTGSGKSIIERLIIDHCLGHADKWRILAVDLKGVEFKAYLSKHAMMGVATNVEDACESIELMHQTMHSRYGIMKEKGINRYQDLDGAQSMIMVIDEIHALAKSGIQTPESERLDKLVAIAYRQLDDLSRLGRSAGLHLVIATQRHDTNVINGEFKMNLSARIAASRMTEEGSKNLLGCDKASRLPSIRGRGYFRQFDKGEECQFYYKKQL